MKKRLTVISTFLLCLSFNSLAQQPVPPQVVMDPNTSMAYDISRIATSVQSMTKTLKDFVDKFAKVEGISLSEKQAKLVVGMQLLVQAEQRVAVQQKHQIDLVEKESQLRARLAQIDIDLDQQGIDRSVQFEGGLRTPEIKENRRRTLMAEKASVQAVMTQLQSNLQDISGSVREAQALVQRLRRTYLPQVERELAEQ